MGIVANLFGKNTTPSISQEEKIVQKINELSAEYANKTNTELKEKTSVFKEKLKKGEKINDFLIEAFATVREASKRTLGLKHYNVQLIGGLILNKGGIAEMKTGEGKTLVATLAAYVNALSGEGVHIVTVNDYLSSRDAVWMGQIYNFLGLTVSVLNHDSSYIYDENAKLDKDRDETASYHVVHEFLRPCTRREAYEADITYGTNSEFGFDYLRDNIAYSKDRVVQRPFNYALVDEIDSILIDEARTPLIISAPINEAESLYPKFTQIARTLVAENDYTIDEKLKAIQLTDSGIEKAEQALGVENIYTDAGIKYVHHLETAVRAQALFLNDRDYVVKDGEVVIVDPFTGRLQPGRRWSEGLHQAIESKEGVKIQQESRTFASVTYQNYFRMYKKLSGMTGTALTSAEEFQKVYGLLTYEIPTNVQSARVDSSDLIFQTENGKFIAIARKIKELNESGQPVLVGTVSVDKNELLSKFLNKEGVKHEMLNAKNHEKEGEIIANAGRKGNVFIATNMAGRGVDIKLGGTNATKEEYEEIKSLGGLFVLGTERHEARRIDNQLRGRSGRQGDAGETQFFISLEDSLMRVFASDKIKNMMGKFGIPEDEPISNKMVSRAIESAQEKIEGFNFDARKHVLEYDDVMNHQRQTIYSKRRDLLFGDENRIQELVLELIETPDADKKIVKEIEAKRKEDEESFNNLFRTVSLQSIDMLWLEHLEMMDYMRRSVNLRAYGQRDPLVEYKKEGLVLFKDLIHSINNQIISVLPKAGEGVVSNEEIKMKEVHKNTNILARANEAAKVADQPVKDSKGNKVGRNDPCPCGSGKKFKKCHGA